MNFIIDIKQIEKEIERLKKKHSRPFLIQMFTSKEFWISAIGSCVLTLIIEYLIK